MFTSRELSVSTMNYVVILREEASARTEEEGSQPERCPTLVGPPAICQADGGGLVLLRSWNPSASLPCSQGSWKLGGVGVGGVCIHKSKFQWPLSQKFLSPYLKCVSLSQSFADTVSLLWNPEKSFPCYLSASTWGKKPSHLELLSNVCHPASQKRVGRSAVCHTHLQND